MNFQKLNLIDPILQAITETGYSAPTEIQHRAIPFILKGDDVLGCAQTGTGKTAAFAIPILQKLNSGKSAGKIRSLILTPTRELAIQIEENFSRYGQQLKIKYLSIFGGVSQGKQVSALQKGVDILIATPGRLLDLIQQGYIDLSSIEIFVLDEADRMLDMGFIADVKKILPKLPVKKQTLFFSATMPTSIRKFANSLLNHPAEIIVGPVSSTAKSIKQFVYHVHKKEKAGLLIRLLNDGVITRSLIFMRTKHGADKLTKQLGKTGINAAAIHGNKSQSARQKALYDFKAGSIRVLVATDIAARGIDINELPHVVNYELPEVPETYVHRIGRTGRAGSQGIAVSLCDTEEIAELNSIQKLIGFNLSVVNS